MKEQNNKKYCYSYPRPAVTVDAIIYTQNCKKILLIQRKNEPFKNFWALPGGFLDENENIDDAIIREIIEETGLQNLIFQQFMTIGDAKRDPRGHTVTIVYFALCENPDLAIAGDDAKCLNWFDQNNLPELAFDHKKILLSFFQTDRKKTGV